MEYLKTYLAINIAITLIYMIRWNYTVEGRREITKLTQDNPENSDVVYGGMIIFTLIMGSPILILSTIKQIFK